MDTEERANGPSQQCREGSIPAEKQKQLLPQGESGSIWNEHCQSNSAQPSNLSLVDANSYRVAAWTSNQNLQDIQPSKYSLHQPYLNEGDVLTESSKAFPLKTNTDASSSRSRDTYSYLSASASSARLKAPPSSETIRYARATGTSLGNTKEVGLSKKSATSIPEVLRSAPTSTFMPNQARLLGSAGHAKPPAMGIASSSVSMQRKIAPVSSTTFKKSRLYKTNSFRSTSSSDSASSATGEELLGYIEDFHGNLSDASSDEELTCYTEMESIATNPQVIAIGILAPPSKSEIGSSSENAEIVDNQQKISETVARDIAEKEHLLKFSRHDSTNSNVVVERRSFAHRVGNSNNNITPEEANSSNCNNITPEEANSSNCTSKPSRARPQRHSIVEDLHCSIPSLVVQEPGEVACDVPPVMPTSTRSTDSFPGEAGSTLALPLPTRARSRKSTGLAAAGLNTTDRQEKVRAARASMTEGNGVVRRLRPYKSHSLGSCNPPSIPVRRSSVTHNSLSPCRDLHRGRDGADSYGTDDSDGEDDSDVETTMRSSQSVATSSSGIDLDEKMRNSIISTRSNSMHVVRRHSSLRRTSSVDMSGASNSKVPPAQAAPASKSDVSTKELLKSTVASSPSVASIPPLVSASNVACKPRPSDSKQSARVSILHGTVSGHRRRPCDDKVDSRAGASTAHIHAVARSAMDREQEKIQKDNLLLATNGAGARDKVALDDNEENIDLRFEAVLASDISNSEQRQDQDLEAQAGVPVVLPGAFAVRPLGANGEPLEAPTTGYDSGFEDGSVNSLNNQDESLQLDDPSEDNLQSGQGPALRPVVSSSPVEARLYEVDYADARVLDVEADTAKAISKRVRILQGFLVLLFGVIVAGIAISIVYSKGGEDGSCFDEDCIPDVTGWEALGRQLIGPTDYDSIEYGHSIAMSADGNRLAIGLPGLDFGSADSTLQKVGGVYVLDWNGTDWGLNARIYGTEAEGRAGTAVSISADGHRIAFAAPDSIEGGYVAMYAEESEGVWQNVGGILGGDNLNDTSAFGTSLALSSDGATLVVGDKYASNEDASVADVGTVRIFQLENETWKQLGQDIHGESSNELLGWSVAISSDGQRIAASAVGADNLKGEVRVFDYDSGRWVQVGETLAGTTDRETFGASIALASNGEIMAIGADGFSQDSTGVGRVRVYRYDNSNNQWKPMGQPLDGDAQFDRFGSAVALSEVGDTLVIGSPSNDIFGTNAGFVEVMHFDGALWTPIGSKVGRPEMEGGLFGSSVTISSIGDKIAAGAPKLTYDGKLSKVGQVWAYKRADF